MSSYTFCIVPKWEDAKPDGKKKSRFGLVIAVNSNSAAKFSHVAYNGTHQWHKVLWVSHHSRLMKSQQSISRLKCRLLLWIIIVLRLSQGYPINSYCSNKIFVTTLVRFLHHADVRSQATSFALQRLTLWKDLWFLSYLPMLESQKSYRIIVLLLTESFIS